jgi:putative ABC transport system ATP-binding protein
VVVASHSAEVAAAADRVLRLTDGRWAGERSAA